MLLLLPLSRFDWDDDIDDVPSHVCLESAEGGEEKEALIKIIMWNNFLLLAFFKKDFPAFRLHSLSFLVSIIFYYRMKWKIAFREFRLAIKINKKNSDWVVDLDEVLKLPNNRFNYTAENDLKQAAVCQFSHREKCFKELFVWEVNM